MTGPGDRLDTAGRSKRAERAGRAAARPVAVAGLVVVALLTAAPAWAGPPAPAIVEPADLVDRAVALIDAAVIARRPVPPVPVPVTWRDRRIASSDLGAPLIAFSAGDLDGDGQAELVLLTEVDVVVMRLASGHAAIVARRALPAALPERQPRDAVGALVIGDLDGDGRVELAARSSRRAEGVVLAVEDGALVERRRAAGFPLCHGGRAELASGQNRYRSALTTWAGKAELALPDEYLAAACYDGLVDRHGKALRATAVLATDGTLHVDCAGSDGPCPAPAAGDHGDVGYAFAVADIDNDGVPELVTSRAVAPGELDRVTVTASSQAGERRIFGRNFHGGVVGIAVADLDGDGDREAVVAVRFAGSTQVTLWTLN